MAAPNLLSLSTAVGKSFYANLTATTTTTLLTVPANQVYKINTITVANIYGATGFDVTMSIANSTVTVPIAHQITVPAKSSLVLTDKSGQFYLEENCSLKGGSTAANELSVIVSYEVLV